jgi:hypothetical protein
VGALWENFIIIERLKARTYGGNPASAYFWRTWEGQELDLIEEYGGTLHAFECKWSARKAVALPKAFDAAYPGTEFNVVNPENFTDFV